MFYTVPATPATAGTTHDDSVVHGVEIETNTLKVAETFDAMRLRDKLLRGIYSCGFEKPSAIQMRGILPILDGHDIQMRGTLPTRLHHDNIRRQTLTLALTLLLGTVLNEIQRFPAIPDK